MKRNLFCLGIFLTSVSAALAQNGSPSPGTVDFDVIIKNGAVYDGTGAELKHVDLAIRGNRIAGIGDFASARAKTVIDANGLAVAPGFINMLSWSTVSLIKDGRSQREIRQGVTTEIMRELVRKEMEAGALGIGTSLIYPPAFYAKTEELIELCKVAAKYQGKYISHMRSEGNQLLEALDELIRISREAGIPAEVYHIKAAGKQNWGKLDNLLSRIEAAQKEGLKITANMYTYTAAGTGLDACLPPWTEDGGYPALFKRLRDPAMRDKIAAEVSKDSEKWENLYIGTGSPDRILLVGFKSEKLKPLTGKSLAEIAKMRGKDPITVIMDLILEDQSRIESIYFLMSEENVRKELAKPWISFGSDEASQAPEGVFLKSNPHPRAYGNFARVLGKYARDENVIPLAEAVRRLSGLPATNLGLDHRGFIKEGMFADVVVFDPATISDRATFEKPHQYAVGVKHVLVNGVQVIKDGEHTGAKPGCALWGPGKVR